MKKLIAIALGTLALTAATTASAQYYRNYERDVNSRPDQECWNPRAGHFEQVRPGESQGDLDFGRCRIVGGERTYDRSYDRRERRQDARQECWNPNARHFEEVRSGETQNDLDFSRCRVAR